MDKGKGEGLSTTPLIDREILFGNPERALVRVSPDGEHLAFLAPSEDDVLNVFVASWDDPSDARQVTDDRVRGIRSFSWAWTSDHILYVQDEGGDENWHVYSTNLATDETIDLTPMENIQARIAQMSHLEPEKVILAINDRNPEYHELYEVDLTTGELQRTLENEKYLGFVVDEQYRPRLAMQMTPEGGITVYDISSGEEQPFFEIPHVDMVTTGPIGTDLPGDKFFFFDSRDRDTSALTVIDAKTAELTVLYEPVEADLADVMRHPETLEVQAVAWNYDRKKWHFFDEDAEEKLTALGEVEDGDVEITSRTLDDERWVVAFLKDDAPVHYYKYEPATGDAEFLFTNRSELEGLPLANMQPLVIEARDGLKLPSYLSLPADVDGDRPDEPLPMVLEVHGGPWARDSWGYNPLHQWYANRGYAALSVNFRGSTGFGKSFINAANLEWGRKMHDDLLDAVQWAVDAGVADPDRIAIAGGSYGGYAVLWGLTNTPDVFACGIDIVGPSNLETLLASVPPYWKPALEMFTTRVGDPQTEEGRELLKARSPLSHVDNISKPLLIAQGANDPRVKQAESDQIVQSMQSKGLAVTYVLYPDEGHGFARPENRLTFFGVAEAFLSEHLGGRYQPLEDFTNSSIHVPEGAGEVPGLKESLCAQAPERCREPDPPGEQE